MKSTQITISELTANPAAAIRDAEKRGIRGVTRSGKAVVFIISRELMEGILETMELQKNDELMGLIKRHKAGKVKFKRVPA